MKLSILIPLYNKEHYIQRCLESILDQDISRADLEIIIVDDGSKDSGPMIVEKYMDNNANIRFIRQENQGPSAARNRCMEASMGDYLYFLDADDYLAENVLKTILNLAAEHHLDVLEFETKQVDEGSPVNRKLSYSGNLDLEVLDGIEYVAKNSFKNEAWRFIVKKKFLERTGIVFIEGTLYEDAIFTAQVFLGAQRISKIGLDAHRYVVVENSIVTSKDIAHNKRFINGMVNAVEHLHQLINNLDEFHDYYAKAVKVVKSRQQDLVLALIIRTLKFRLLNIEQLKQILKKLKSLEAYPITRKRKGPAANRFNYKTIFIPIFNNQLCLIFGLRILKMFPK